MAPDTNGFELMKKVIVRCLHYIVPNLKIYYGGLAEWLRRQSRKLMGNSRAGSNPAAVEIKTNFVSFFELFERFFDFFSTLHQNI
jgi:hypothetical protein